MNPETVGSKMRIFAIALLLLLLTASMMAQSPAAAKPTYQTGTIMQVKEHQPSSDDSVAKKYDVSVRVGSTIYVVVYEPPPGNDVVQYKVGASGPVLIEGESMKFSDLLGNTKTLPIVSRKQVTPKNKETPAAQ